MSGLLETAYEQMQGRVGEQTSQSEWFEVTQDRINDYADVSMDHQWIHVDVDRANKESPFGAPIAHGNLTLAIMGHLPMATVAEGPKLEGQKLGINYGFDKLRFINPVKVNSKIRGRFRLISAEEKNTNQWLLKHNITVEIAGEEKPALVAEWLGMTVVE